MMFSQGVCCRMKRMWWWPYRGCIQSFTSIHIWFHSHDHGQRTLAATMAVYSPQESPVLALEVNLSISFYSLVDTYGFLKPGFSLQLYVWIPVQFEVLTHSLLMISKCLITNSHPSVLNEFLLPSHESWRFRTFNTQHVQCYPELYSTSYSTCQIQVIP